MTRTGEDLYVNGMPAHTSALAGGIVALSTGDKTVHMGAAEYWGMVYDDIPPTPLLAGILLAQLHELRGRLKSIAAQKTEQEAE
jgi:hypothetical protein